MAEIGEMLIQGAMDLHVHTAPDIIPRKYTDIQLAKMYQAAGMAGFVCKCHQGDTAARAAAASEAVPAMIVCGGIVLNHAVGGWNEAAVYACGKMGGRIVWFPTVDAYQRKDHKKLQVLDENQKLIPEIYPILQQIKEQDMILATGHLSPRESLSLLKEATKMGIHRLLVTHVSFPVTKADLELQREYLACGAVLEHCYYTPYYEFCSWEEILESIAQAGAGNIILSSDFGQILSPDPSEGMKLFAEKLYECGISAKDIRQMMGTNPKELLG